MSLLLFAIWYALGLISFGIIKFKISTFTKGDLVTAFLVSFMGLFVAVVFIMERNEPGWFNDLLFKKKKPTDEPIKEYQPLRKVSKNEPIKTQKKANQKPKIEHKSF